MDRASEFVRRVAKAGDSGLVRALAQERENICDAVHIPSTPHAPNVKGAALPTVLPAGTRTALGSLCALARISRDAVRLGQIYLRASDTCYGYLIKYTLPASKAPSTPVRPTEVAPPPLGPRADAPLPAVPPPGRRPVSPALGSCLAKRSQGDPSRRRATPHELREGSRPRRDRRAGRVPLRSKIVAASG